MPVVATWHDAGSLAEIPTDAARIVDVAGKRIGLFRRGDEVHALLDFCPHAGAPICQGKVFDQLVCDERGRLSFNATRPVIRCPWHRWEFELSSGLPVLPMAGRLRVFRTRINGERVEVEL